MVRAVVIRFSRKDGESDAPSTILLQGATSDTFMEEEQSTSEPDRQVYLREGTVVLRWLFGYYDRERLPGWTSLPRWPRKISTWKLRKPKTRFRRVTLVSIDVDGLKEHDGMPIQFHIGISVLHTQDLHEQCRSPIPHIDSTQSIIRSHHWIVEDRNYPSLHDNRFCFGKYKCIPLSDLEGRLKELLRESFPIILIVHGGHRELTVLQKLNINLNPVFTIDTTKAVRYPLQSFHDYTLKKLLKAFDIPWTGERLHFAGNDAHFTLRALLMIAVTDVQRELEEVPAWVPVFEAIARAPLPPMPLSRAQKAANKKRAKSAALEQSENGSSTGAQ